MVSNRTKSPFWRRKEPRQCYDIAVLRPRALPKGHRFETAQDVRYESERSELLLRSFPGHSRGLAKNLCACREGDLICDKPYCPICARKFRRWLIAELLRVAKKTPYPIHILTVLLEQANSKKIDGLDPVPWRHRLRKRLVRSGLGDASVIGGFEMIYRQRQRAWVLHANLVIIGGAPHGLEKFEDTFHGSDLDCPVLGVPLQDLPEQLSYVSKFTTYHRPFQQRGPIKSPAIPLNAPEHHALVQWMSRVDFKDFLFLFNAHREKGVTIKLKRDS